MTKKIENKKEIKMLNNTYLIEGEINNKLLKDILIFIDKVNEDNSAHFYMSSLGGDVFAGFAIYNFLTNCDKKIIMENLSIVSSAGLLLFLAGDKRLCHDNAFFMVHNYDSTTKLPMKSMEQETKNCKWVINRTVDIYKNKMDISEEEARNLLNSDRQYVYPKKAKKINLITDVV